MRIIGIDYGTKRVGVSISDEHANIAFPHSVLECTAILAHEINKIAVQYSAEDIVIGESKQYDMKANTILPDIMNLKRELESMGFKVTLELEFMTSIQATHIQGKNKMIDASAATIILQSYLDRMKTR
jgi:putative Holliday junction resolvase